MGWNEKIKIKHLLTEKEDYDSIQNCMNNVADVLESSGLFVGFDLERFRKIPKGDDVFGPVDYANKFMINLYDFADEHRIWVG